MAEQAPESSLPNAPNLDWLRRQAKRRLEPLRRTDPGARLADAQFDLAKQYGSSSWRALKRHVDSLTVEGQLFEAARNGDVGRLGALLRKHPETLHARTRPHEHTLLHLAAASGRVAAVALLLRLGLDVNSREKGDNTYPMHWAAAAGHLEVVRLLADSGGDVVGRGDDHALQVIGWATCWDGCDDAADRQTPLRLLEGWTRAPAAQDARRAEEAPWVALRLSALNPRGHHFGRRRSSP